MIRGRSVGFSWREYRGVSDRPLVCRSLDSTPNARMAAMTFASAALLAESAAAPVSPSVATPIVTSAVSGTMCTSALPSTLNVRAGGGAADGVCAEVDRTPSDRIAAKTRPALAKWLLGSRCVGGRRYVKGSCIFDVLSSARIDPDLSGAATD